MSHHVHRLVYTARVRLATALMHTALGVTFVAALVHPGRENLADRAAPDAARSTRRSRYWVDDETNDGGR